MIRIISYFKKWSTNRVIAAIIGGSLLGTYFFDKNTTFLFVGIFLIIQAITGSGCMAGNCTTASTSTQKKKMINWKKLEKK